MPRSPAHAVAALAVRQHLQVHHRQLLAAGLTGRQVRSWVATGRLHRVHHEVCSVGAPPATDHARWMAAVLATGGVLCGASAGALWQLWSSARSEEHVLCARSARFDHRGIRVHRPRRFDAVDATVHDRIAVTTPARTLLDLAATLAPGQLDEALQRARVDRRVTDACLRDVLARYPHHRGTRRLGDALTGPFTRSALERRFIALCAEHGLPHPRMNVVVAGEEVDAVLDGVLVELDGKQHAGAWAKDARKDEVLRATGASVLRLTWWDVTRDRARSADRLRRLLAGRHERR